MGALCGEEAATVRQYSQSCGRSGPRRSLDHASEGTWRRLSEGLETERLGKIPEDEEEEEDS